jgi:membrane fusion protein (multidrug efflux system)
MASTMTPASPPAESSIVTPSGTPPAAEERRLPPGTRRALIVAGAIALLVLLFFLIRFIAYARTHQTTDDAMIDADQVDVTSKISERVDRILVDTNQQVKRGQVLVQLDDRDETARLAQAQAGAQAAAAQARAAQANVTLARETQQAQNAENTGAIVQAQSGIEGAGANAASATDVTAQARAEQAAALADLRVARDAVPGAYQTMLKTAADLRRTQSLVTTGDLSQSQLDAARAAYQAARSSYTQAQANVGAAAANVSAAEQKVSAQANSAAGSAAQIGIQEGSLQTAQGKLAESSAPSRVTTQTAQADAAAAQVATAKAQLKTAQDQLSYTRIRSAIDGYVGAKNVEIGQTISPGNSLMTIVPNTVYITANYKETQLGDMHPGQPVDINVDAYNGVKFHGHVENISPASQNRFSLVPAQNATGNFVKVTQRVPVRVVFDNPDPNYPLRPGMSIETSVKVK